MEEEEKNKRRRKRWWKEMGMGKRAKKGIRRRYRDVDEKNGMGKSIKSK